MRLRCLLPAALGGLTLLLILAGPARGTEQPAATGWTWPLAPRPAVRARFVAPTGPYSPGHRGVDLAALPAARVLAAGPGVVAFAGRVAGRGVVSVDHPGGLRTTYEPVTAVVARGDPVTAGAVLGLLEGAGSHCAPSSCLHWGVRRGEAYLDPLALLGPVRVRLLPVWGLAPGTAGDGPSARQPALVPAAASTPVRAPPAGYVAGPALLAATSVLAAGGAMRSGRVVRRGRAVPRGSEQRRQVRG